MSDQPNFDLLEVAPPAEGVLAPAEFSHTEVPASEVDTPDGPIALPEVFAQPNINSGYRPVTGAEINDYLRAKGMGLEGRPSKVDVEAFLLAKGVRE